MDRILNDSEREVMGSALKRLLVSVRADYDTAVEIGDPLATRLRDRRETILSLIETIEDTENMVVVRPAKDEA